MAKKKKKQRKNKKEKSPIEKVRKPIPKPEQTMESKKEYKRKNKYPRNWKEGE